MVGVVFGWGWGLLLLVSVDELIVSVVVSRGVRVRMVIWVVLGIVVFFG